MTSSKALFTTDQVREIEAAIKAAEQRTCAEIVVAVRSRSGRYHRAADLFGLLIALAGVTVAAAIWPIRPSPEQWDAAPGIALHPALILAIFAACAALGAMIAGRQPALTRLFTRRSRMLEEVTTAGTAAFHALRVHRTANAHGVLVYISLFERMVWVVGDDGVNERISVDDWARIRDRILEGFKSRAPAPALIEALTMTGDLLSEPFPADANDPNELPDTLHLLD